jgi:hypothetical protein
LELAARSQPADLLGSLDAVHWSSAKDTTAHGARGLVDAPWTFGSLATALFSAVSDMGQENAHDIDSADSVAIEVFKRTFSKLRFLASTDEGEILVDLGGHLRQVETDTGRKAVVGIALARNVLTAKEFSDLQVQ